MERTIRLAIATREELLLVIQQQRATIAAQQETIARLEVVAAQQQVSISELRAVIAELEQRLAEMESRLGPGSGIPQSFPGHKPRQVTPPAPRPRKQRQQHFTRKRSTQPDAVVMHALEQCPSCQTHMLGGWVKRRREVIEVAPVPARVVEHQYWERQCPNCGKRATAKVDLGGEVVGQTRLGVNLVSLIATLREAGRLPIARIQEYLETIHGLHLSVGTLVHAVQQVARAGERDVEAILEEVRSSGVVNGDETGWREQGRNRYAWIFRTEKAAYFVYGGRNKEVVDEVLGPKFAGVLATDFYASYDHYEGPHQRCWVHLLRDVHELKRQHPNHEGVRRWARELYQLYRVGKRWAKRDATPLERRQQRERLERALAEVATPYADDAAAPQRVLSKRVLKYLNELFVYVERPDVSPDNNAAERGLRHLVTVRKISGGSRSTEGTAVRMTSTTLFSTWKLRGLNPFIACRQLFHSPHP